MPGSSKRVHSDMSEPALPDTRDTHEHSAAKVSLRAPGMATPFVQRAETHGDKDIGDVREGTCTQAANPLRIHTRKSGMKTALEQWKEFQSSWMYAAPFCAQVQKIDAEATQRSNGVSGHYNTRDLHIHDYGHMRYGIDTDWSAPWRTGTYARSFRISFWPS